MKIVDLVSGDDRISKNRSTTPRPESPRGLEEMLKGEIGMDSIRGRIEELLAEGNDIAVRCIQDELRNPATVARKSSDARYSHHARRLAQTLARDPMNPDVAGQLIACLLAQFPTAAPSSDEELPGPA